jgi:surface protein
MHDMFNGCSSLTTLDLSSFNTEKVWNMEDMFNRCYALTTVYVSNLWSNAIVTSSNNMFNECSALVGGAGTTYNSSNKDHTYARIDGGPNSQTPGYFTYKEAPVVSGDFGNRMLLLWRQVGGKEYRLYKALDKNQYRTNADGWKMYLTQLTLDIVDGNDITTVVVDEGTIYTDDNRYNDATIASMMIDKERNMMYVFNNSKADGGGYSMNGYAYLSPVDQPAFNKEIVFEDSNWGWFSIFTGTTNDGQPVLSHFSYAGYYDMVSTRIQEGYWTSESLDNIMPDDMNARWAKTNKVTVVGDTSDDEVTVDGLVYTLRSNNQAAISWVNEKDQLEQLKLPSQINHGGTVRTVTAIAPFAFYWCSNLHELNIPSSVSQIEELALRKCSALEKLRVDNATPPYLKNDEEVTPFDEATCENAILYVPYGAKAAYQETNGWKDFKNIEEFGDPVALDAEPYAVLSDNNTVLTFYYDDQKANRNGMDVGPFYWDTQSWLDQKDLITTVVFDNSFAECTTITSTSLWFTRFSQLTNIIGISNLNTNNVTDMSWMFCDCPKLESLDLSNFNTANVTSMREMFGRTTLKQIDLSSFNTENVTDFEYMFDNSPNLTNINMSSFSTKSVTNFINMFSGCSSLASIQAGSAEIPAEEYTKIGNPNLLLYVNEARLAPEGVQNIVVNGVAKEIVLTDNPDGKIVNNNWYCPEPFRAEKISYTRDFRQQTQIGISRGWESLALPFAVQTITHQDKGAIAPFGSDASGLHFWLRRLGHEGLISVQMIEPNTPYIISMPNSEDYASRFNLNGRVTFAAEDAYVERTEQMEDESADYMMVPTFQRMPVSEYVYALNVGEERNGRPEGSIFERNYREVRPFEAYTLHRGDQPAPLSFDLSDLEGSTTDVPGVRWMMDDGNGEWYDLQGRKLGSTLNVQRSTLKKGVYIHNGRKTVVK